MTTPLIDADDGHDGTPDYMTAAQYVLGTLDPAERLSFQAELQLKPELRALTHAWERRLNPLTELLVPQSVPSTVWERIEARLDAITTAVQPGAVTSPEVRTSSTTAPQRRSHQAANDRFWLPWAWVSTGLAAGLALFIVWHPSELATAPQVVQQTVMPVASRDIAVLSTDQHQAAWIVRQQGSALVLSGLNAAAVPSEHDLELWSIQGKGAPKSLGVIHVKDGQATLPLTAASLISGETTLAISLEPKNGSPTGAPTGAVLYTGKVVSG
jgi:anti-sigma-K factor RskA